jgi:hypothetical protein
MESSSNVASGNVFPFAAKGNGLCPPAAEADVSPPAAEANGLDANGHPQRKNNDVHLNWHNLVRLPIS